MWGLHFDPLIVGTPISYQNPKKSQEYAPLPWAAAMEMFHQAVHEVAWISKP